MDTFIVSSIQPNRTPTFCWVCKEPITVDVDIAICRWPEKAWERAHVPCAEAHPANAENAQNVSPDGTEKVAPPKVGLFELEPGQYPGRNKYVVRVEDSVIYQCGQLERARGVIELLERNPNLISDLANPR